MKYRNGEVPKDLYYREGEDWPAISRTNSCTLIAHNESGIVSDGAGLNHPYDLIKSDPSNWPVDKKLWVRSHIKQSWNRRYFSHYEDGKVYCFQHGLTSWSSSETNHDPIAWSIWEEVE